MANVLLSHGPWRPWRFRAADYRALAATAAELPPLTGTPVASPWDPALAQAMGELEVRVEEEVALADLLADVG
ncbi:DUF2399 domain-containing protein [Streptomyces sp. NPDC001678]|uniref:DUF2399 domain-containing protein n=1 Tax=Streptomyces sp. NPDC001678 TaxID=3364599 RepID=UPI0036CC989B